MATGFKNKHRLEFKDVGVVLEETVNDWATSVPSLAERQDPTTPIILTSKARVCMLSPKMMRLERKHVPGRRYNTKGVNANLKRHL
jgi:hypothetical protein